LQTDLSWDAGTLVDLDLFVANNVVIDTVAHTVTSFNEGGLPFFSALFIISGGLRWTRSTFFIFRKVRSPAVRVSPKLQRRHKQTDIRQTRIFTGRVFLAYCLSFSRPSVAQIFLILKEIFIEIALAKQKLIFYVVN